MAYSKHTFIFGASLTAAQMNQIEENIAAHVHGRDSVGRTGISWPASSKSSGFTVAASDAGALFLCTSTFEAAFAAIAGMPAGWAVTFHNVGSGTITLNPNSSETIDGQTTIALIPGQSLTVYSTGTEFRTIVDGTPVGTIIDFAGATAPSGWLFCDELAISRTAFAALFNVIGTTYGVGDGSTTFNKPDLRGRAAVGKDNMGGNTAGRITSAAVSIDGTVLGAAGGAQTVASAALPSHNHELTAGSGSGGGQTAQVHAGVGDYSSVANVSTTNTSGATVSSVVQPTIIVNKIIKY